MEPSAVVKDFKPFENNGPGFGPRREGVVMHELALEAATKAHYQVGFLCSGSNAVWLSIRSACPSAKETLPFLL